MSKNRVRQQALSATARANPSPAATLPPPAAALPTPTANTNPNPSPAVTTPHPAAASPRPTSDTNPNPSPAVTTPPPAAASPRPMSDTTTVLNNLLKELRLPTFREQFQALADQATREGLSYPQYLAELVRRECQTRNHSRIQRLLRNARLLPGKTWAQFNWSRVPLPVARQLQSLREGTFLDRRENLLVFGKPGSGKTHLLAALGEQLVQRGRSVLFATCSLLVQELLAAKRDLKLERFIKRLAKVEALIIDDLGYVQQSREEMEVLFILLAERYERGSVLLTSNQPFSQWQQIFKDPMTTAAAIDRLVHHSVIIELNITSYRLETAKNTRKTSIEAHPLPPSP
jgi:DNA replication protein DnaC